MANKAHPAVPPDFDGTPARHVVGIDAGKDTGLAAWDTSEKRVTEILTLNFWGTYFHIIEKYSAVDTIVIIEDPNLNKPTFNRSWVKSAKANTAVSQNVGGVKRETHLLAEGLSAYGFTVYAVRPGTKKWDKDTLKMYTGWAGRTSQHGRDAAKLIVGHSGKSNGRRAF